MLVLFSWVKKLVIKISCKVKISVLESAYFINVYYVNCMFLPLCVLKKTTIAPYVFVGGITLPNQKKEK